MNTNSHASGILESRCHAGFAGFFFFLLVLMILLAYGQSLFHDFAWDDFGLIVENDRIKSSSQWIQSFSSSFWDLGENTRDPTRFFYRPVIVMSYMADHTIWKLNPFGYHLTNIIAHILCSFAVFFVMLKLIGRPHYAALGSLLWAIHPSHVENVAWISGRTDIFCGLFFFSALYFFICAAEDRRKGLWYHPLSALLYLAALLSKEMALTFTPCVVLYCILAGRRKLYARDLAFPAILYALVTAGYLAVRIAVLGQLAGHAVFGSLPERLLTIPMVFMRYIGLLLNLVAVDPHHADKYLAPSQASIVLLYALLSLCFIVAAVATIRRGKPLAGFGMLWILLVLLPVFNLGTFGDILYADRFLYIPSFGAALLIPALLATPRSRILSLRAVRVGLGAWLALYTVSSLVLSRAHTTYWKDSLSLFSHAVQTSPDSAYIHYNLGYSLAERDRHEEALASFQHAVVLEPRYPQAYACMGISLNALRQYKAALHYFKKSLKFGHFSDELYNHMGVTFMNLGKPEDAERCYRNALSLRDKAEYRNNLGECLLALGNYQEARWHFLAGLEMEPSAAIYNNMAILSAARTNDSDACAYLERALDLTQNSTSSDITMILHYNLARFLARQNRMADAQVHARAAKAALSAASGADDTNGVILQELNRIMDTP